MNVPRDCTVREARWRINRQLNVPALRQTLVFGTSTLADDIVLGACAGDNTFLDVMLVLTAPDAAT